MRGMFDQKFHQLAMYVDDPAFAVRKMKSFGHEDWIHDRAKLVGECMGTAFETEGEMWFNYDFYAGKPTVGVPSPPGAELEFLHYHGQSWHSIDGRTNVAGDCLAGPFFSHMSVYVGDVEREVARMRNDFDLEVVQWFETHDHINKYLKDRGQRFYEFILDTRLVFGFDLKLIQRIQD